MNELDIPGIDLKQRFGGICCTTTRCFRSTTVCIGLLTSPPRNVFILRRLSCFFLQLNVFPYIQQVELKDLAVDSILLLE